MLEFKWIFVSLFLHSIVIVHKIASSCPEFVINLTKLLNIPLDFILRNSILTTSPLWNCQINEKESNLEILVRDWPKINSKTNTSSEKYNDERVNVWRWRSYHFEILFAYTLAVLFCWFVFYRWLACLLLDEAHRLNHKQ